MTIITNLNSSFSELLIPVERATELKHQIMKDTSNGGAPIFAILSYIILSI